MKTPEALCAWSPPWVPDEVLSQTDTQLPTSHVLGKGEADTQRWDVAGSYERVFRPGPMPVPDEVSLWLASLLSSKFHGRLRLCCSRGNMSAGRSCN